MTVRELSTKLTHVLGHYYAGVGLGGTALYLVTRPVGLHPVYRVSVPGVKHRVGVRIGTTDVTVLRQTLQERHYDVTLPFTPTRIIDAGANIGASPVYFANVYPRAEIVAIEPEESNFRLLTQNTRSYPNIRAIRGALASEIGDVTLFDPDAGHHGFRVAGHGTVSGQTVPGLSVPSVMAQMGWTGVDLLKMDIEGAEKTILETSRPWIDRVGAVMIELHDAIAPGSSAAFEAAVANFEGHATRGEIVAVWRDTR